MSHALATRNGTSWWIAKRRQISPVFVVFSHFDFSLLFDGCLSLKQRYPPPHFLFHTWTVTSKEHSATGGSAFCWNGLAESRVFNYNHLGMAWTWVVKNISSTLCLLPLRDFTMMLVKHSNKRGGKCAITFRSLFWYLKSLGSCNTERKKRHTKENGWSCLGWKSDCEMVKTQGFRSNCRWKAWCFSDVVCYLIVKLKAETVFYFCQSVNTKTR